MTAFSRLRGTVRHPFRWMLLATLAIVAFSAAQAVRKLYAAGWTLSPKPIENCIWICDSSYAVFYAPHTPQSLAIVRKIQQLRDAKLLPADFRLDQPTLITPAFYFGEGRQDEPTIIIGFNPDIAITLRKTFLAQNTADR